MSEDESVTRADARIHELGTLLRTQMTPLTAFLHEHLRSAIEPLQGDQQLLDLMSASIESNLESLVKIMRNLVSVADTVPPAAAAEYARRLAQRGISATALIRAYRLAQQAVVDWAFVEFEALEPDREVALLAGRRFADMSFDYIDSISEGLVGEYEAERERWLGYRGTVRADMIEQLLSGGEVNALAAEVALGYRLSQRHVAVVLWSDDPDTESQDTDPVAQPILERLLDTIATSLGSTASPLFFPRDRHQAWGWVPLVRDMSTDEGLIDQAVADIGPGTRASLGTVASGIDGFRSSHAEALRARQVSLTAGVSSPLVTSFADSQVRTASLLAADLPFTRRLVRESLGGLAADTDAAARLRDTLLHFLTERGSFVATGERVHLHKNTIKYRVGKAIEARGRSVDDERLELELALVACRWLGSSVLPANLAIS